MAQKRKIVVFGRPKLTLHLKVGGLLDNGYHEVEILSTPVNTPLNTVMFLDYPPLTEDPKDLNPILGLSEESRTRIIHKTENHLITTDSPYIPDEGSLAHRVVNMFTERFEEVRKGRFWLHVSEDIPTPGGLGGASCTAATVMKGINRFFDLGLTETEMLNLLKENPIGSDVPLCLIDQPAKVYGAGEVIIKTNLVLPVNVILITPKIEIPKKTGRLYKMIDEHQDENITPPVEEVIEERNGYTYVHYDKLDNSFEHIIKHISEFQPVDEFLHKLRSYPHPSILHVGLAGAGPTVYLLVEKERGLNIFDIVNKEVRRVFTYQDIPVSIWVTSPGTQPRIE